MRCIGHVPGHERLAQLSSSGGVRLAHHQRLALLARFECAHAEAMLRTDVGHGTVHRHLHQSADQPRDPGRSADRHDGVPGHGDDLRLLHAERVADTEAQLSVPRRSVFAHRSSACLNANRFRFTGNGHVDYADVKLDEYLRSFAVAL